MNSNQQSTKRQLARFALVGGTAFLVDAAILTLLMALADLSPYVARVFAIGVAMVVAWLMNRRWTFAVARPAKFSEFARYAAVGILSSSLNYIIFAAILLVDGSIHPLGALVVATSMAAIFSFVSMRHMVFRPTTG